jgi:hypothetical protein
MNIKLVKYFDEEKPEFYSFYSKSKKSKKVLCELSTSNLIWDVYKNLIIFTVFQAATAECDFDWALIFI